MSLYIEKGQFGGQIKEFDQYILYIIKINKSVTQTKVNGRELVISQNTNYIASCKSTQILVYTNQVVNDCLFVFPLFCKTWYCKPIVFGLNMAYKPN